ncbi:L-asparaginase 1 [Salipiger sp. CCB-MM3]|uniref:asparaginase n=1 Tax=Salipiger sp. CCB-MM3 TaxID=1792508 RepID=UPI00080AA95D|nr:asparaginase [Salipiger sp. CCB-MM3]ANT62734.1 L-asparaginase 1 [Salipiger sp. CCB-MM3]
MRLLLIHTGGTIGMAATPQGFAPQAGVIEDALQRLQAEGRIPQEITLRQLDRLIDSAEATPREWNRLSRLLADAQAEFDGVVVTHGTDTLAFSAAALCLALRGLTKQVIVTGSMLPLTVEGSDGWDNLADALNAATRAAPGVWVQFAGRLLHGARVRKAHSSALDAFAAAESAAPPLSPAAEPMAVEVLPHRVAVLSIAPGACTDVLRFAAEQCDGIVLRCYGAGTAPDTPQLRAALALAAQRQVPVVAVSQSPEGGINLGTYAAGGVLRESGVIDGRDMTPEMAYAKLHYALSLHASFDQCRAFLETPVCGEMRRA